MHVDWVKWYDYVGGENHGCECKANAEQTFVKIQQIFIFIKGHFI